MSFADGKQEGGETSESFFMRSPLKERIQTYSPQPFHNHIQELMFELAQKRTELREVKLLTTAVNQKIQKQDDRMKKIKINLEHCLKKEEIHRENGGRLNSEIADEKQAIKLLAIQVNEMKNKVSASGDELVAIKKQNIISKQSYVGLQPLIQQQKQEYHTVDKKIQHFQMLIGGRRNQIRAKQDQIDKILKKNLELGLMEGFLSDKIKLLLEERHQAKCEQREISQKRVECDQKFPPLKKQIGTIQWETQKNMAKSKDIEGINQRLQDDLQGTLKHLKSLKKSNDLLVKSLQSYGVTVDTVTKIINSVKFPQ